MNANRLVIPSKKAFFFKTNYYELLKKFEVMCSKMDQSCLLHILSKYDFSYIGTVENDKLNINKLVLDSSAKKNYYQYSEKCENAMFAVACIIAKILMDYRGINDIKVVLTKTLKGDGGFDILAYNNANGSEDDRTIIAIDVKSGNNVSYQGHSKIFDKILFGDKYLLKVVKKADEDLGSVRNGYDDYYFLTYANLFNNLAEFLMDGLSQYEAAEQYHLLEDEIAKFF